MASFASEGCVPVSEFLHEQQRALKEKQVAAVIAHLQTTNVTELVHTVKSEVGSGLHLTHFPERKQFWERCVGDVVLDEFVAALRLQYARLLGECLKGREKYAGFQVKWMGLLRLLLHEPSKLESPLVQLWEKMVQSSEGSAGSRNAIGICIARSVFMCCQKSIVTMKEGETLLLDGEQSTTVWTDVDVDEASLYRLGGYALHSTIKAFEGRKGNYSKQLTLLHSLRMPVDEKVDLPPNIFHLDKGGMTFMRKELLENLAKVHSILRENTSAEHARTHGQSLMKVIEEKVTGDDDLLRTFRFACTEVGVTSADFMPDIHETLVKKMVHTHGNELLENKRMLGSIDLGITLDVPLMLREKLKVMASKDK